MPSYEAVSAWLQISFGLNTLLGVYAELTTHNSKAIGKTGERIINDFISATSASSADKQAGTEEPNELALLWKITVTDAVNGYQKKQKMLARWCKGMSVIFAITCALLILFGQELIEWAPPWVTLFWLTLMAPLPVYLLSSRCLKKLQVQGLKNKTDSIRNQYEKRFGLNPPPV